MTDSKPKRRWFSFSIRDLLLVTVIAALAIGWWLDHRVQVDRYQSLLSQTKIAAYPIAGDVNKVLKALQAHMAGISDVKLAIDTNTDSIVAIAGPDQQAVINEFLN